MPYADVILPLPVKRTFTYHVPKDLAGIIAIGKRVRVPLGLTRNYTAIVARLHDGNQSSRQRTLRKSLTTSLLLRRYSSSTGNG